MWWREAFENRWRLKDGAVREAGHAAAALVVCAAGS